MKPPFPPFRFRLAFRLLATLTPVALGGCVAYAPPYDAGYAGYYGAPAYAAPAYAAPVYGPAYYGPAYVAPPLILDFGFVSGGHRYDRGYGHRSGNRDRGWSDGRRGDGDRGGHRRPGRR